MDVCDVGEFEEGYVLGMATMARIVRRAFERKMDGMADVRRAYIQWQREAQLVVDAVQTHRIGHLATFYGFDSVWTRAEFDRVRTLLGDDEAPPEPTPARDEIAPETSAGAGSATFLAKERATTEP